MGGGERYTFALADVLSDAGFDVTVAGPTLPDTAELAARGFSSSARLREVSWSDVSAATDGSDLFVQITAYPPVKSSARRSFAVVQFPIGPMRKPMLDRFHNQDELPWYRQHRSREWYRTQRQNARSYQYIVYSDYVRGWLRRRWRVDAAVLAPPVELGSYSRESKKPTILAVGRFFPEVHRKRHDVLIEAFRSLSDSIPASWQFVLVGGVDRNAPGAEECVARLESLAEGRAVTLRINTPQAELQSLYEQATLFWHAAGFGRGRRQPDQAEHFGIAVVEAMSYGAMPLVFADGGPRRFVQAGWAEGWRTVEGLVDKSRRLIDDPAAVAERAANASAASQEFSERAFGAQARALLLP
jgi:glycosyltransferase involved in cell wall biosynthesis